MHRCGAFVNISTIVTAAPVAAIAMAVAAPMAPTMASFVASVYVFLVSPSSSC
jgi:hypothetical protein